MARRSVRVNGRTLERLRVARGFGRQSDLAEAAGVSASTVSRAENGSKDTMLEESAGQIAAALGVPAAELLAEPTTTPPAVEVDAVADRIVDKLAERLPAIVRAILAEANANAAASPTPPPSQSASRLGSNTDSKYLGTAPRRISRLVPAALMVG